MVTRSQVYGGRFYRALKIRKNLSRWIAYFILTLGGGVVVYPFFYMVMNSFKPGPEILHAPMKLPSRWVVTGYIAVWRELQVPLLFRNSLILAVSITLLNLLFDSLAAYALSKLHFPGRDTLFNLMLATLMIPGVLFLIPTYVIMYRLGWVGHFRSLIIPASISVYNIFLMKQFMQRIPDELIDAARIDGCGELGVYFRIVLPLSRPVLTTVAILTFMGSWNDFFGPLLYLMEDPSKWTVQLGLHYFNTSIPGENAEQVWAATTAITVPLVLLYFFLQDQFMKAFAGMSLK